MTNAPYTGYTRATWERTADDLLLALRPWASMDHARIDLPGKPSAYGPDSDSLEAFARSFLLAAARLRGAEGNDPQHFAEWYAAGLKAGTDPGSPTAWPRPDRLGQAKVEACSIALGLHLSRPWLWDKLSSTDQERVVDWLGTVVGEQYPPINWVWFQIVVETFLKEVGGPWSRADLDSGLAVHESLYRGNGWYADGPERAFDHYNGWALHVYPLLWASMDETLADPELVTQWRQRLRDFLNTAVHLVGGHGAPLAQGRSLTYRFAAAAPFWVGAITGATDLPPGQLRRAASAMLKHFLDRGVPDERGLLNLGWYGENPAIAQSYSGPGSPYWAVKGMLGLMLPADHPVWTADEEPLPVETGDFTLRLPEPGWLVSGTRADGIVRIVNHGTDHSTAGDRRADSPLYARLAYSTHTLPQFEAPSWAQPLDNSIAAVHPHYGLSHRNGMTVAAPNVSVVDAHWVLTAEDHSPEHGSGRGGTVIDGPRLTTGSLLRGSHEVRAVRVASDVQPDWLIEVSGWPATGDLTSTVSDVVGLEHAELRELTPGTVVPFVRGSLEPGKLYVAVVTLAGAAPEPAPTVRVDGTRIEVTWTDGTAEYLEV
ncbi:DUF2264 domain-containing protein [Kribbella sp. HUAS MG21]|uniref:DUF2264 domain-containing protein n=1 Tax=Kribbella sp. HUAS MG21 TaxID=3160966 RepID=A0AAU7TEU2_9ACTN